MFVSEGVDVSERMFSDVSIAGSFCKRCVGSVIGVGVSICSSSMGERMLGVARRVFGNCDEGVCSASFVDECLVF